MDKQHTPLFVGGASLLTIFAVLCLSVFALLSVSTARSSGRIAQNAHRTVIDYYAADTQAQTILARLRNGQTVDGVKQDGDTYAYRVPLSEGAALEVAVRISDGDYELLRYQTVNTDPWAPNENIPVWDGQ